MLKDQDTSGLLKSDRLEKKKACLVTRKLRRLLARNNVVFIMISRSTEAWVLLAVPEVL